MAIERNGVNAVQAFKSKYPGAYDKYSDSEILDALKRKYPDKYNDLAIEASIAPTENVLQRVAKTASSAIQSGLQGAGNPLGVSVNPSFPFMPTLPGDIPAMSSGMEEAQMPITQGDPMAQAGMALGSGLLAGGKMVAKPMSRGISGVAKNLRNPSKVFGESIERLQSSKPSQKVDFFSIINNALEDPMAKKILDKSKVLQRYGGRNLEEGGAISERLSNLSLKESQDLVNAVKSSIRKAVRKGDVGSNEIGISKMFKDLSEAQRSAFEGFKGAQKGYGIGKNVGQAVKKAPRNFAKAAITGAGLGVGGKVGYDIWSSFNK